MGKEKIMAWIIGVLLVLVVIQTIQLNVIAGNINEQEKKLSELETNTKELAEANVSTLTVKSTGGGASLALEKLKDLPQMVGGC